jgi:hypothetical protein
MVVVDSSSIAALLPFNEGFFKISKAYPFISPLQGHSLAFSCATPHELGTYNKFSYTLFALLLQSKT